VDIIDETLDYFKANVLFRSFEVKGGADRVLIYLTLYAHQCLSKMVEKSKGDAEKLLFQLAIENFSIPGDKAFALGGFVSNPSNRAEADQVRQYLTQLRQETGKRLIERVYATNEMKPSKWWVCFVKRKFMNTTL